MYTASCREVQVQLEEVHEGKSSIIYELTEFQQAEMMFREVNIYLVQTFWFLACINNLLLKAGLKSQIVCKIH